MTAKPPTGKAKRAMQTSGPRIALDNVEGAVTQLLPIVMSAPPVDILRGQIIAHAKRLLALAAQIGRSKSPRAVTPQQALRGLHRLGGACRSIAPPDV